MTILPIAKDDDNLQYTSAEVNPVVETANFAFNATNLVTIDEEGVISAAQHIYDRLLSESYTPRSWRTHPLHICPPEPYSAADSRTGTCMNWIFFISSLNFSFWSEKEGHEDRFGILWKEGWGEGLQNEMVHTGYWSLVAALDRALEEGVPITDPAFYSSETRCPPQLLEHIFRPAPQCSERIALFNERVKILREVGTILLTKYEGSFQKLVEDFQRRHDGRGTALQLVKHITETFPSFRDETIYNGRRVFIWKRAQILVAELWAAFYPPSPSEPHPLFPSGAAIHHLTMFADYRVPQILHHLKIITYPPFLLKILRGRVMLETGCREELSIRSASIVAVERVKEAMIQLQGSQRGEGEAEVPISSVLIDFYLWDLAKRVEVGADNITGIKTVPVEPAHRTRSIWY
ncbi:hypothetical protein BXZ70DRAFT_559928 [Cristinia sonorae]|uniref:Queuosine 5'-phosphate N-glycosylase/hydrolase n=1 Tax=Cristinia sonorae TaxID=1940300 RepID=A0A8K0XKY5_9AGAR|nr:hypothetical protein BXZ70DRAFT_559928 [Cristinia sonorae]